MTDLYAIAELLDRAIRDEDWSKAKSVLSMIQEKSDYEGNWIGVNEKEA